MFGLGIVEILILAGVLVLLFGAKGAPAMARKLGTSVREVKGAVSELDPRSIFDAEAEPAQAASEAPAGRVLEATPAQRVAPPAPPPQAAGGQPRSERRPSRDDLT